MIKPTEKLSEWSRESRAALDHTVSRTIAESRSEHYQAVHAHADRDHRSIRANPIKRYFAIWVD
jgi:hypothetical protein